ncbi:MAG: DUF2480 family protein [candidate division Zixibacteria bacterium]|nr:DUF2480 family protein [candidate division Zixibacteria bacterium]
MEILELKDFANQGAFFEDDFDARFAACDWQRFDVQAVRISNCGLTDVPGWVYLSVGIELSQRARKIFFGDNHNPRKLFVRKADANSRARHET